MSNPSPGASGLPPEAVIDPTDQPHHLAHIADRIVGAVEARLDSTGWNLERVIAQQRANRELIIEESLTFNATVGPPAQVFTLVPRTSTLMLLTGLLVVVPPASTTATVKIGDKVIPIPAAAGILNLTGLSWLLTQTDPRVVTVGGVAGPGIYVGWGIEQPLGVTP